MIQGVYQSASSLQALQDWTQHVAHNLSAASTPGYKKTQVIIDRVALGQLMPGTDLATADGKGAMHPRALQQTDFHQGMMRRTGDPLEFALDGDGFFQAEMPDGRTLFTRDGQFQISPEGQLRTKSGFPVMGVGGPIQLIPGGGPLEVDEAGRVRQNGQDVGQLDIVRVETPEALLRAGGGFILPQGVHFFAEPALQTQVRQGFIEESNVSAIHEMTHLIYANNLQAATSKVISTFDENLQKAIQALGQS